STGNTLLYATYLGGSGPTSLGGSGDDLGRAMSIDASGNAYVTGATNSSNFPTTPGAVQTTLRGSSGAFVAKLNASGTALLYATYLGGSSDDAGYGIAVDTTGNAYVTGLTTSNNFPTTPRAMQPVYGGSVDAF